MDQRKRPVCIRRAFVAQQQVRRRNSLVDENAFLIMIGPSAGATGTVLPACSKVAAGKNQTAAVLPLTTLFLRSSQYITVHHTYFAVCEMKMTACIDFSMTIL